MANFIADCGLMSIGGGVTTPVALTVATQLTLPTAAQKVKFSGGPLIAVISLEGTGGARYTTDGVTVPTAAVGLFVTTPTIITITGDDVLSKFSIFQAGASSLMTYQFYMQRMI